MKLSFTSRYRLKDFYVDQYVIKNNIDIYSNNFKKLLKRVFQSTYPVSRLAYQTQSLNIMKYFARYGNTATKRSLASNAMLSYDLMEILSRDQNYYVRYSIVANSNTPLTILKTLCLDYDPTIRATASIAVEYFAITNKRFLSV